MGETVGTVRRLSRYPVKSMLGEQVESADLTPTGLAGDRRLALLDRTTGRVASAKHPTRWGALLGCAATAEADGTVRIRLPDGRVLDGTGPAASAALSDLLGRPVAPVTVPPAGAELERADPEEVLRAHEAAENPGPSRGPALVPHVETGPLGAPAAPGTFVDYGVVHLLTTGTLAALGGPAAERYRPNLLVGTGPRGGTADRPFAENDWLGREIAVGPDAVLRVTLPTPRCAVPTLAHGRLPRDPQALRAPAARNLLEPLPGMGPRPCAGVYADVLRPGAVRAGDELRLR